MAVHTTTIFIHLRFILSASLNSSDPPEITENVLLRKLHLEPSLSLFTTTVGRIISTKFQNIEIWHVTN